MKNRIKLLRSPLMVNAYNPIQKDLPDDITLEEALEEAREFCKETDTWSGFLHMGDTSYLISGGKIVQRNDFPWKVEGLVKGCYKVAGDLDMCWIIFGIFFVAGFVNEFVTLKVSMPQQKEPDKPKLTVINGGVP